jgi:hypothetical protein
MVLVEPVMSYNKLQWNSENHKDTRAMPTEQVHGVTLLIKDRARRKRASQNHTQVACKIQDMHAT